MATNKERLKELTDQLEARLQELFSSDRYAEYLKVMSQFHHYSVNNTMLIALQKPEATLVAGYQAWEKKFKRHVMKGEKGIRIISPAPHREIQEQEKRDPQTGAVVLDADGNPEMEEVTVTIPQFRPSTVFDISQTDGEPLPDIGPEELTASVENYRIFMEAIKSVSPVPIRFADIPGEAKGFYDNAKKEIVIKEGMSESQTMKTAVYETAHALLHDRDLMKEQGIEKDQMTKEVEAESVAFVTCAHFELDTSDYSFPYIAGWSSGRDTKELKSSMDIIRRTASEIIDRIEESMREQMKERQEEIEKEQEQEKDAEENIAPDRLQGNDRSITFSQPKDVFVIFQLNHDKEGDRLRFMNMDYLKKNGIPVDRQNYHYVYSGKLERDDTLDSIYERFNTNHPKGYKGHSLSVGDVVILSRNGHNKAYFVDSFGFAELEDFAYKKTDISHASALPVVTDETIGFKVEGHEGNWETLYGKEIAGEPFFLMENQEYGDKVACLIVDSTGKLVAEDLWNGFDHGAMEAVKEYLDENGINYSLPEFPLKERYSAATYMTEKGNSGFIIHDNITGKPYLLDGQIQIYHDRAELALLVDALNESVQKFYTQTFLYAQDHNENELYSISKQENIACKTETERLIRENFDGMNLNDGIAKLLIERFGVERVSYVLANTVRNLEFDARISAENKSWAKTFDINFEESFPDDEVFPGYHIESYPSVLNDFVDMFRKEMKERGMEQSMTDDAYRIPAETGREPRLSFYVAECSEFPTMGEYHDQLSLPEAVEIYESIPSDRMHGVKGIGFDLDDGSIYSGSCDMMQGGLVDTEIINSIEHYRNSPLVQQALQDIREYYPDRDQVTKSREEADKPDGSISNGKNLALHGERTGGRTESVLQALRERQEKIKDQEDKDSQSKENRKRKGEITL